MATATIDVSGQKVVQLVLTANLTNITLTDALDQQVVTLEFIQNGTGGFTAASSSIPSLVNPNLTANTVSSQTFQYTAFNNTWNSVPGVGAPGVPQIVAAVNANSAFGVFNTAAAVTLAPAGAPAGIYRLTAQLVITTSFVTNTEVVMAFGWTDADQASTLTLTTAAKTAGTYLPATAGGAITALVPNSQTFYSTGATAITYTPSVTGTAATAGAAQVSIVLERLA